MASSQRHEAGASPWAAQRSRSEPRQQTPMSSVPKFGERCRGILGETPQVRLAPEAEGKMKTLHDAVLLSSSGTCLHVLYLPRLEGKSESVALGSALCNKQGCTRVPVTKPFLFETENSLQTPTQISNSANFTAFWVCLRAGLVAQHPVPGWAGQQHWGWAAQPLIQNFLGEGGWEPTLGQSELCLWQRMVTAAGGTDGDIWHTRASAQGSEMTPNPCSHSRHSSMLWGISQRNSCHPAGILPASPEDASQYDYI